MLGNADPRRDTPPEEPTITTKTGGENPAWQQPVSFPEWRSVLDLEPLDATTRERYANAVIAYLAHLKKSRMRASIAGAKQYLQERTGGGATGAIERAALRWFFVAHRRHHGDTTPPPSGPILVDARTPMPIPRGTPAWEVQLIETIRMRGLLWNTEQIYRGWMRRFAAAVAPVSPEQASVPQIRDFLSALAIRDQVAASTQRQALNALVFYFREVLRREIGDLGDFRRASRGPHIPVVLSRIEVRRLFDRLADTWRLMAELQYGSGLRVTELVELRINSLDLDRCRLLVFGGKGNKDRATVLPERLVDKLQKHVERLRVLFAEHRRNKVPGVWLPRGLERKFSAAGTAWNWQWLCCSFAARRRAPAQSPLRFASGPALNANRGLTIFALRAASRWRSSRVIDRPESYGGITSSTERTSE